jgi:hypothetical protein
METDASSCVSDNSGYANFLAYLSGRGVTSNLQSVEQSKVEAPSSTDSTSEGELKERERWVLRALRLIHNILKCDLNTSLSLSSSLVADGLLGPRSTLPPSALRWVFSVGWYLFVPSWCITIWHPSPPPSPPPGCCLRLASGISGGSHLWFTNMVEERSSLLMPWQ